MREILIAAYLSAVVFAMAILANNAMGQEYQEYQPIVVKHEVGAEVQIFFAKNDIFKQLDEIHFASAGDQYTAIAAPPGSYLLNADGKLRIINILGGNVPPDDDDPNDPPDTPDVPTDRFDNIGQRVAGWTKGLSKNKELAGVFRQYADTLEGTPRTKVSEVLDRFNQAVRSVVGSGDEYEAFRDGYIADIGKRWVADSWGTKDNLGEIVAEYYRAIADGLQVAQ